MGQLAVQIPHSKQYFGADPAFKTILQFLSFQEMFLQFLWNRRFAGLQRLSHLN